MEGKGDLKKQLDEEVVRRIKIIESRTYDPGPRLNYADHIAIMIVGIVSIIGLIWGVY